MVGEPPPPPQPFPLRGPCSKALTKKNFRFKILIESG